MKNCRICGEALNDPVYASSGLSITSVRHTTSALLTVYMCPNCFHVQKPALKDTSSYYDKEYRISLDADDFDQLYDMVGDKCIYRTDYQSELVLNSINIPLNAKILDYGAGKASTLMKMYASRTDLIPYVFDVSDNYKKYWQALPPERQATYKIPASWKGKFSLIMAHFVLEHVEDPCLFFKSIIEMLVKDGFLFFTVPNLLTNPGDLLAIDHINHFSTASINTALNKAGLTIVRMDKSVFRGAIVGVAKLCEKPSPVNHNDSAGLADKINDIMRFWADFDAHLGKAIIKYKFAPTAIFGAGVYGSYIAAKIKDQVPLRCFLDNSPHLINSEHMGFPVISPHAIPEDIRVIYSGLNPSIAKSVLSPIQTDGSAAIIFFDEGAFNHD